MVPDVALVQPVRRQHRGFGKSAIEGPILGHIEPIENREPSRRRGLPHGDQVAVVVLDIDELRGILGRHQYHVGAVSAQLLETARQGGQIGPPEDVAGRRWCPFAR